MKKRLPYDYADSPLVELDDDSLYVQRESEAAARRDVDTHPRCALIVGAAILRSTVCCCEATSQMANALFQQHWSSTNERQCVAA